MIGRGALYRALFAAGFTLNEIATRYGVSKQAVSAACGGRSSALARQRRYDERTNGTPTKRYRCRRCGGTGHTAPTCKLPQ